MAEKNCFIIMPISTPESWLTKYSNDKDHFKHVLEHFLIPSLEKADLKPTPPITKGSELIQADIITNIETADLVLCDISTLNPNVFFELGIRTALNKPVCLIKDDTTPKIPFDTASINHHEYLSALNPWTLGGQIDALANHIEDSQKRNNDANSLWKYFSLSSTAHPVEPEKGIDGRIDYLTMQIEALRNERVTSRNKLVIPRNKLVESMDGVTETIERILTFADMCDETIEVTSAEDSVEIRCFGLPHTSFIKHLREMGFEHGIRIDVLNSYGKPIAGLI